MRIPGEEDLAVQCDAMGCAGGTSGAQGIDDGGGLRGGVVVRKRETTTLPLDTLKWPGILETSLPDSLMALGGYVYVPGTSVAGRVDTIAVSKGYIEIDSVPAGILPHLYYRYPQSTLIAVDTNEISIDEQDTTDFQFESDDTLDAVQ